MLRIWGNRTDPSILAVPRLPHAEMLRAMARARFCPIFGGNSPWSTRLIEAMMARCVPVFFSSWLPPFSRLLDWERFSVRVASLDEVPHLKTLLEAQPYETLASRLPLALGALWYRVYGNYRGDDVLPFLLVEMRMALLAAAKLPLAAQAVAAAGMSLELTAFEDDAIANRTPSLSAMRRLPLRTAAAVHGAPRAFQPAYRGGVTVVTNRSSLWPHSLVVWRCVPLAQNGHSFRACDPLAVPKDASEASTACDVALADIRFSACLMVNPKQPSKETVARVDPLSPTQQPANHSLVRANRDFYKAIGFRVRELMPAG